MLDQITPVLLTHDEEPNIARTLSRLQWANDIVIVDSGSTDRTVAIACSFPQVRLFERPFDSHANQWNYAVTQTNIKTKWLLRLDADYQLSDELMREISRLDSNASVDAYRIGFDYAIYGRRLSRSLYPPNTILLRPGHFSIVDCGHTERWFVEGAVRNLSARIIHDDWKPMERWIAAQGAYMKKEVDLLNGSNGSVVNWLRRHPPLMPVLTLLYCLFGQGLIMNGRAGLLYALQRMTAESILSLILLEKHLKAR